MSFGDFDIVTLSPSTVRVMHKSAHHIYEFSVIDDGRGRRTVSKAPAIVLGKGAGAIGSCVAASTLIGEAARIASDAARFTGVID